MSRKYWIILVILVSIVVWGGWFFVVRHQVDKQKFDKIDEAVSTLTQSIADEFDLEILPTKNYCSVSEGKYSDGPLTCVVSGVIAYNDSGTNEIVDSVKNQSSIVTGVKWSNQNETVFEILNNPEYLCGINKTATQQLSNALIFSSNTSSPVLLIECAESATRAHYELVGNN